jgi:hypothetical protein
MASLDDVVSTIKTGVTNIANIAQSIANVYPAATTTVSPKSTAVNNLGTTAGTVVIGTSSIRRGIMFHNPGTAAVYLYPTSITTAPTTTSLGGTILIAAGSTLMLPP